MFEELFERRFSKLGNTFLEEQPATDVLERTTRARSHSGCFFPQCLDDDSRISRHLHAQAFIPPYQVPFGTIMSTANANNCGPIASGAAAPGETSIGSGRAEWDGMARFDDERLHGQSIMVESRGGTGVPSLGADKPDQYHGQVFREGKSGIPARSISKRCNRAVDIGASAEDIGSSGASVGRQLHVGGASSMDGGREAVSDPANVDGCVREFALAKVGGCAKDSDDRRDEWPTILQALAQTPVRKKANRQQMRANQGRGSGTGDVGDASGASGETGKVSILSAKPRNDQANDIGCVGVSTGQRWDGSRCKHPVERQAQMQQGREVAGTGTTGVHAWRQPDARGAARDYVETTSHPWNRQPYTGPRSTAWRPENGSGSHGSGAPNKSARTQMNGGSRPNQSQSSKSRQPPRGV